MLAVSACATEGGATNTFTIVPACKRADDEPSVMPLMPSTSESCCSRPSESVYVKWDPSKTPLVEVISSPLIEKEETFEDVEEEISTKTRESVSEPSVSTICKPLRVTSASLSSSTEARAVSTVISSSSTEGEKLMVKSVVLENVTSTLDDSTTAESVVIEINFNATSPL